MLKEQMYVRCAIDADYPNEPRNFILGKIKVINYFSESASIEFYDLLGLNKYYNIPSKIDFPLSRLYHCKIEKGTLVKYNCLKYHVAEHIVDKNEDYYFYYLVDDNNTILKACETDIVASLNSSEVSPVFQLKQYEFQNPMWYFGRQSVAKTSRTIDSAFYGFRVLSGCKIFLKPYQLKTVMRCLSEKKCRYMIADEVGLGKTIEAASVLKVYLYDNKNKRVLICVPDALTEQWKTELAFKFRLFEGKDKNGNIIEIRSMSKILLAKTEYDFIIIDEVHSILNDTVRFVKAMRLSRSADNIILLSATPVQSRNEEYHKLLSLIQPEKYENMREDDFLLLLELQNKIVRKVYSVVEYLSDYKDAIEDSENEHTEDTEEIFEELVETIEDIADRTEDNTISEDIKKLNYEADNFSVPLFEKIVAYICESYQLEKCVIRNRRKADDSNIRELIEISYDMDCDFNNTEFRIYGYLSDWISSLNMNEIDFDSVILPLVSAFFSSSAAFYAALKRVNNLHIPEEIKELSKKWVIEDKNTIANIMDILEDPYDSISRMIAICDYIQQEAFDKKVLVFTHYPETQDIYKQALVTVLGDDGCAFFREGMSADDLELNTYRFQNNKNCHVMLSDETGGEGRNFQMADELICIDIPWSANTLEQRIGRLDRIGRDKAKKVISVIVYAKDTVEQDLVNIWSKGLHIFSKSQSGLEIIMHDIDNKIKSAVADNFKYGLDSIVNDMIDEIQMLEKRVKEERHFDIAAYQYQNVNMRIEKVVERCSASETELFHNAMMSWASLAGFNGKKVSDDIVRFNANSFSIRSAYNTMLIPPDMELMIGDRLNRMQNRVRALNGDKEIETNPNFVQGTFDRNLALKSDYLHFFAPGDELYDSIVNNSISAYKGRCSAFAVPAAIDWEGFVFSWYVTPDELFILQNNVPLMSINQYRGFIPPDIFNIPVAINDNYTADEAKVKKEIQRLSCVKLTDIKYHVAHYGQRSLGNDFLGIKQKFFISNLDWFKEKYPYSLWAEKVSECYKASRAVAVEEIGKRLRLKALKETLSRKLSADTAASEYFGSTIDLKEKERINDVIFKAFSKPKLILDAVCYIRMIKND